MAKSKHPLAIYRDSQSPAISQAEFARRLKVGRSTICEIESLKRAPSVKMALDIERLTGGVVTAASLNPLLMRAAQQAAA